MYFLVDFENVRSNGLRGAEYLDKNDYLTLFFSSAAHSCENRYLEEIEQSGCVFDTCKLVKTGKNGLDFYILPGLGSFMEMVMMIEWLLSVKIWGFMLSVTTGI